MVYITVSTKDTFREVATTEEELNNTIKDLKERKVIRTNADYYITRTR